MKKTLLSLFLLSTSLGVFAQDAVSYQLPPKAMADLLLAKPTPTISIDGKAGWMLLSERNSYPSVEQLAMPEFRIAGLRINPANFSLSRQAFISNFSLKNMKTGKTSAISGLPVPLFAGIPEWNPGETKISFTNTTAKGVDLYIIDVASAKATKVNKQPLNVVLGNGINWVDNETLLYRVATKPASAVPAKPLMPKGPTVQQNLGKASPSPTYQDLIKSPYDEQLFEFFGTSQLVKNKNGVETPVGQPAIYTTLSLSPDKKYVLQKTINKPFSYLVTYRGFPSTVKITDLAGKTVKVLAELPSTEGTPSGYDNTQNVARDYDWRDDEAATVTWAMPLDSGLIKKKVQFHDAVFALGAPFTAAPKELFKTEARYRGTSWGDAALALVYEGLRSKQTTKVSRYNPTTGVLETLYALNQTDAYNDPGDPVTTKNKFGRHVVQTVDNGTKLLMNNTVGSSPKGDLPFLAKFDLAAKKNEIIWRSAEGSYEYVADVIDANNLVLLTRRESQKEVPNYFIKNLKLRMADQQVTSFGNPYPGLDGISKEKISYKRADGVDLTGNLYLPKGYDKAKDGPLPTLIWAYPREFNSASDAAQIRGSKDRFTTIIWASPIFWVTQGYAVLDEAEMPIVAKDGKKPNDTYVEQLVANAEAAVNKLSDLGVGDRNRMAVGGHSYGAFMTANLLAHTKLFKAGIARSGAYNRTLTPFGFQNEERTYWEVPQLYYEMSPFSYADKIKTPILLIHGDADDNQGTFPINSERLFNAIKGFGGTTRFVFLPFEAHSYRGKENLLHMLWEMNNWLDTYVKNAR
ncbi:Dipeptidyl aminopeptidase/acylaminoacyl peptidase [Pedobacter westerhofensis]|uniref:Dipeptidyl aminopeptidase/acylaminoacyl peptidase n=1 Tax=Pedobacter westerhofensis TaxID=425512 RepID=A0A521ERZ3_9SPHI|nr:prolyl oligopeptidase family serine peptidase [Pedobacter westerhofensis]SMO86704.1 Dipeptidyl aminopeptidase/acylaminoacyl peptidase [Pedobacter westerhofensis]